jgi:hypothetical protein
MANSDINTTTVNRRGKFFRLIDGTILEFTAMLDCNCNPTDNPDECIIAMYEIPDGLFKGVDLRLFSDDNSNERASVTDIQCTAINRREMFFRLEDDTTIKFTAMLDCNCNQPTTPMNALSQSANCLTGCSAPLICGYWMIIPTCGKRCSDSAGTAIASVCDFENFSTDGRCLDCKSVRLFARCAIFLA